MTNNQSFGAGREYGLGSHFLSQELCYLNLPCPPKELLDAVPTDNALHASRLTRGGGRFHRSTEHSRNLNEWCQANISQEITWDLQIIEDDLPIHRDYKTNLKLSLVIYPGGDYIETRFYDPALQIGDQYDGPWQVGQHPKNLYLEHITRKHVIEPRRWHLLRVSDPHTVIGIEPGKCRISLVANIC